MSLNGLTEIIYATNLKMQTERRMSYKLETAHCSIYPKKMVVFVRLKLMTFTLERDTLLTRLHVH